MNVLHITNSVSLRAGGLYTSVRELALAEQALIEKVNVAAYWDERTEQDAEPWKALAPVACKVRRLAGVHFGNAIYEELERQQPNLTHVHGLWLRSSGQNHRWAKKHKRPYVIAPRGMLDPWAVCNSGWKKKIAGYWFEYAHLRDCSCLHALCEEEAHAFRKFGLKNPICIIPNGISLPDPSTSTAFEEAPPWASCRQSEGKKILLFIGRIHPKKGLHLLIDALGKIQQQTPNALTDWFTVIAGYNQVGHQQELEAQLDQLGLKERVLFVGLVTGAVKGAALKNADAFILPSFSEGLPMSVLEAWAHRLPVVMTPQCNLPLGFSSGAAIRVETNATCVADGLRTLFSMSDATRRDMGTNGYELARREFTWDSIAKRLQTVYTWLLGSGEQPDSVSGHGI